MHDQNLNDVVHNQADFESYLKGFRPSVTSASIAETFYQAGWRAAVAPQRSSAKKPSRGRWAVFLSGAACGMLPMLILLMSGQADKQPVVSRSDLPLAPPVQPHVEATSRVDVVTGGAAKGFDYSSQPMAGMPSAINAFADSLMLQSWFPRLQISESSMSSSSVLRFRPLTSDVMDMANIDQGASAASNSLTTAHDAAQSVDRREPLSARSSALNDESLRELFL